MAKSLPAAEVSASGCVPRVGEEWVNAFNPLVNAFHAVKKLDAFALIQLNFVSSLT